MEKGKQISFETKMNQFFIRNCYTQPERDAVKAWPAYRVAAENEDTIAAQEIATQVQESKERPQSFHGTNPRLNPDPTPPNYPAPPRESPRI